MRPVLFARPDRDEETRLILEGEPDLIRNERG
jgi:hypothetical protein